ncbi:hypothetical protein Echvi_4501 [Echinicola vietnamensis DSM 17526]|uniref:Uncharacterized protein n=1 Tax=Echinicola vietnamensis (strain DSM 17526 / LMG 23754 / KMM 6221) TaxID=926556 RepID=L0G744_ECHVK|nr:hypothetical protein Echvi_4501 [Echinicola vietnamensis DSM 17526]
MKKYGITQKFFIANGFGFRGFGSNACFNKGEEYEKSENSSHYLDVWH